MTAEVVVLNKFGIALAADSAVTVDHWHKSKIHTKVYNTANKLFTLSKFEPVGIMFYNTVTLGGIPWETIVKVHRKHLARTKHETVEQYANAFFDWLKTGTIFSASMTTDIVETTFVRAFVDLEKDNKSKAKFISALDKELAELRAADDVPGFDDAFRARVSREYRNVIRNCCSACIKRSHVAGQMTKIIEYCGLLLTKKRPLSAYSGIVIAGFGETEALPRAREYIVDLVVLDRVRFWLKKEWTINETNHSEVIPLADAGVIRTLIEGISPGFANVAMMGAVALISGLPKKIFDPVKELTDAQKQQYVADARTALPQHFREFADKMTDYRAQNYTRPIKQAIASLSLSDLAMVAETFLGASQIQKRVTPELESVGGPVDVAVISKGDGFVWIKRKLYFEDRFNPSWRLKYLEQ